MPSLYRIYFSRDSTVLSLPINPEKLPETKESDNGEYNVLGLGPVMQPRTPKLRKVTISGLFPGRRLPWMSAAVFLPPSVYITFFKSAMDGVRHTKEHFDEMLDIVHDYEDYCQKHKNFPNGKCVHAIDNINRVYDELLESHDFL